MCATIKFKMNENFCEECKIKLSTVLSTIEHCANSVFRELGYGLGESVYQAALAATIRKEFDSSLKCSHALKIVANETIIPVSSNGLTCGSIRSDLILHWKIGNDKSTDVIIELKATSTPLDEKTLLQLLAYLRATNIKRGILINFTQKSALLSEALQQSRPRNKKRRLSDSVEITTVDQNSRIICINLETLNKEPIVEIFPVLLN